MSFRFVTTTGLRRTAAGTGSGRRFAQPGRQIIGRNSVNPVLREAARHPGSLPAVVDVDQRGVVARAGRAPQHARDGRRRLPDDGAIPLRVGVRHARHAIGAQVAEVADREARDRFVAIGRAVGACPAPSAGRSRRRRRPTAPGCSRRPRSARGATSPRRRRRRLMLQTFVHACPGSGASSRRHCRRPTSAPPRRLPRDEQRAGHLAPLVDGVPVGHVDALPPSRPGPSAASMRPAAQRNGNARSCASYEQAELRRRRVAVPSRRLALLCTA